MFLLEEFSREIYQISVNYKLTYKDFNVFMHQHGLVEYREYFLRYPQEPNAVEIIQACEKAIYEKQISLLLMALDLKDMDKVREIINDINPVESHDKQNRIYIDNLSVEMINYEAQITDIIASFKKDPLNFLDKAESLRSLAKSISKSKAITFWQRNSKSLELTNIKTKCPY